MEDSERSPESTNSYLQTFGNSGTSDISENTNSSATLLPPFGSFSQSSHQEGDSQRDVLMPIQQNIIGSSSTNFNQAQSRTNVSTSPLSKSNSSLYGSTSSSILSTSSEGFVSIDGRGTNIL